MAKNLLWLFANVTANVCGFCENEFQVFKKLNYICLIKRVKNHIFFGLKIVCFNTVYCKNDIS